MHGKPWNPSWSHENQSWTEKNHENQPGAVKKTYKPTCYHGKQTWNHERPWKPTWNHEKLIWNWKKNIQTWLHTDKQTDEVSFYLSVCKEKSSLLLLPPVTEFECFFCSSRLFFHGSRLVFKVFICICLYLYRRYCHHRTFNKLWNYEMFVKLQLGFD